jgi:membrane-bound serine protease (ClpP class)
MLATILILILIGILAVGMEFFLPGGVLGVAGALALSGAVVMCFTTYGATVGLIAAAVTVLFVIGALSFWLKYFDKIGPGKDLMLKASVKQDDALARYKTFLNAEGVTKTPLKPAGKAQFGDQRLDVVAESGSIDTGDAVRVVKVEGSRVVVRRLALETPVS